MQLLPELTNTQVVERLRAGDDQVFSQLYEACYRMVYFQALKEAGEPPHHIEGHRGGTWVLLDFSSVVVHIFMDEARRFYDLERLWSDAAQVDLTGVLTQG